MRNQLAAIDFNKHSVPQVAKTADGKTRLVVPCFFTIQYHSINFTYCILDKRHTTVKEQNSGAQLQYLSQTSAHICQN